MAKGGRQPGAGRPKGSTNLPKIRDYFTQAEIEAMVEMAKTHMVDDLNLLRHMIDHIFGKAPQSITGAEGKDLFPSSVENMTNEQLEAIIKERSAS